MPDQRRIASTGFRKAADVRASCQPQATAQLPRLTARRRAQALGNLSQPLAACRQEPAQEAPFVQFLQPRCQVSAVVPIRSKISASSREIAALPSRNNRPVYSTTTK